MKKINYLIFFTLFIFLLNGCAGYKPIFSTSKIQFTIKESVIEGDKELGNKIYSKLYNLSKSQNDDTNLTPINIIIESSKNKKEAVKDKTGKVLEYKITLTTKIKVINHQTNIQILNQTFKYSTTYKTQDEYSDTLILENRSTDDLANNTYQDILLRIAENI